MTLDELKEKHPGLYEEAIAAGRKEEQQRLHRTCPWVIDILRWHRDMQRADGE